MTTALDTAKHLKARIESLTDVGALPEVMARIMELARDPNSSALDLAAEISHDPALSMKILRTVNSAYYGLQRRIMTIPDAVVILGFDEVERLALTITVIDTVKLDENGFRALRALWRHSLACSIACTVCELKFMNKFDGLRGVHVAGLLHDIGKVILGQHFPELHGQILHAVKDGNQDIMEAERAILGGVTHCDVGGWVAERWNLPEGLVASIRHHHSPAVEEQTDPLVHTTHVADCLTNALGYQAQPGGGSAKINPASSEIIPLDDQLLGAIREQLVRRQPLLSAVSSGSMF